MHECSTSTATLRSGEHSKRKYLNYLISCLLGLITD